MQIQLVRSLRTSARIPLTLLIKILIKLNYRVRSFSARLLTACVLCLTFPCRRLREYRFRQSPKPPRTILVSFLGRGLGDAIYFSGILKSLRVRFPEATIELAVRENVASYFRANPFVTEIISCPDYYGSLKGLNGFFKLAWARRKKKKVDLLLNLLPNLMLAPALWDAIVRKKYSIGAADSLKRIFYDRAVPIRWNVHFFETLTDSLKLLGVEVNQTSFWIPPDAALESLKIPDSFSGAAIIIAPGGRRNVEAPKDYCWSFNQFPELIQHLTDRGHLLVLTGAPYDRHFSELIKPHPRILDLIGRTDLLQIFTLVKKYAKLVICNNSGILHIASTQDIPTVSYADPQENMLRWCPYPQTPRQSFLQDTQTHRVSTGKFLEAVDAMLDEIREKKEGTRKA